MNIDDVDNKVEKKKNRATKLTREFRKVFKTQKIIVFVNQLQTIQELKANLKGTDIIKAGNKLQNYASLVKVIGNEGCPSVA